MLNEDEVTRKKAAPLQITAEQILTEAYENKERPLAVAKHDIADIQELRHYQAKKRTEYENALRRNRLDFPQWIRYALWELDQQHEVARARSIFERALEVDATNIKVWMAYIQAELRHNNVNHARNLLDRAVTIQPRVDKLWFTFVQTEEGLDNVRGARAVFERWIEWNPPFSAWNAYISLEKRYKEYDRARQVYRRLLELQPEDVSHWIHWAKFEEELADKMDQNTDDNVRSIFNTAIDKQVELYSLDSQKHPLEPTHRLILNWAKFEAKHAEWERAQAIFKIGLQLLPKSTEIQNAYSSFEKQHGDKEGVEQAIAYKRRRLYEEQLSSDPHNYDVWFSYIGLIQSSPEESPESIRALYERAVGCVPSISSGLKTVQWRRYVFLWIRYAIYEELQNNDIESARKVYTRALNTVPHRKFTFAKLWTLFAQFELRHSKTLDPSSARKIMGQAIGRSKGGTPKIYKSYIEMEIKLKEFDRCRILYENFILKFPSRTQTWLDYTTLEGLLGDQDRARALYELALCTESPVDDKGPIWQQYIEFEIDNENHAGVVDLFERLLKETNSVPVWQSYAVYVTQQTEDAAQGTAIFQKAWNQFKFASDQDRYELFESWRNFEETSGSSDGLDKVNALQPTATVKRRALDDGTIEEYESYVFPDDESTKPYSKFLENARKWAQQRNS